MPPYKDCFGAEGGIRTLGLRRVAALAVRCIQPGSATSAYGRGGESRYPIGCFGDSCPSFERLPYITRHLKTAELGIEPKISLFKSNVLPLDNTVSFCYNLLQVPLVQMGGLEPPVFRLILTISSHTSLISPLFRNLSQSLLHEFVHFLEE